MAARVKVPLWPGSDGDATHVPTRAGLSLDNHPLYLEKLAMLWMKDRGEYMPRVTYYLEALPAGYALYCRPREKRPTHIDRYLYGHPSHKAFDSPNRFYPHFKYLMDNGGNNIGCPCTVCNAVRGVIPPINASKRSRNSSNASQIKPPQFQQPQFLQTTSSTAAPHQPGPRGRPKNIPPGMDTTRVDEEGTPDVYRNLINKLRRETRIDEPITEPLSIDWRAEQKVLPQRKADLTKSPQSLPRIGELVLFVRYLPEGISIVHGHPGSLLYDTRKQEHVGVPSWEAGYIGQVPHEASDDTSNVSLSGVRVEPLPNPNDEVKSESKQYTYVSVNQTRPFVFWKEYLGQVPKDEWHPTIHNALTVMASVSLVNKYRFRGTWPEACIFCDGIYLGSELLAVGDTIRILPKKAHDADIPGVLVIKSIRLKLSNLDLASENDYDEGRPYNSSVHVYGRGYTTEPSRSSKEWLSFDDDDKTAPMDGYPPLYPLHPSDKEMVVPIPRIVGRLFEPTALAQWSLGEGDGLGLLHHGVAGVEEAREYAREHDQRIDTTLGSRWFWADSRTEALDLHEVNGLTVSKYDDLRNTKEWRKTITSLDSAERNTNHAAEPQQQQQARRLSREEDRLMQRFAYSDNAGSARRGSNDQGEGDRRGSSLVRKNSGYSLARPGSSSLMGSSPLKRRKSQVIGLSDDDDDEETESLLRHPFKMGGGDDEAERAQKAKKAVAVVVRSP